MGSNIPKNTGTGFVRSRRDIQERPNRRSNLSPFRAGATHRRPETNEGATQPNPASTNIPSQRGAASGGSPFRHSSPIRNFFEQQSGFSPREQTLPRGRQMHSSREMMNQAMDRHRELFRSGINAAASSPTDRRSTRVFEPNTQPRSHRSPSPAAALLNRRARAVLEQKQPSAPKESTRYQARRVQINDTEPSHSHSVQSQPTQNTKPQTPLKHASPALEKTTTMKKPELPKVGEGEFFPTGGDDYWQQVDTFISTQLKALDKAVVETHAFLESLATLKNDTKLSPQQKQERMERMREQRVDLNDKHKAIYIKGQKALLKANSQEQSSQLDTQLNRLEELHQKLKEELTELEWKTGKKTHKVRFKDGGEEPEKGRKVRFTEYADVLVYELDKDEKEVKKADRPKTAAEIQADIADEAGLLED